MKRIAFVAFSALLCIAAIIAANYFSNRIVTKDFSGVAVKKAGVSISVLDWNLGYAGLGEESDFVMDGGENLKPPSKDVVRKNLRGIQETLKKNPADLIILQEISEPDMLTLGVNVLAGVRETLSEHDGFYSSDFRTALMPTSIALRHGLASFSKMPTAKVEIIRLMPEPDRLAGVLKRQYHMQLREFEDADGNEWSVYNLHLSAFDQGGNIRLKQLNQVIEIAQEKYGTGRHVVVGGDWNMLLSRAEFSYTTDKALMDWQADFPVDKLPPGWQLAIDDRVPTNRSNERPYVKGENYLAVIDGFMVSPNVETLSVKTIDLGFKHSDHQPVLAEFTAKSN